jgi:copper resistance protein D
VAPDLATLGLFAVKTGLIVAALLAAGVGLQAVMGVIERRAWRQAHLRRLVLVAAVGVLAFAGLRVLLLTVQLGGAGIDLALLGLAWTVIGSSTLALAAGAMLTAGGLLLAQPLALVGGAGSLAAGFALTGHSQGLAEPGLAPAAVALHVLIASFWVAAPVSLAPAAGVSDTTLVERLKRFSQIALLAVPAVLVLGLWLSWRLAGGVDDLFGSLYGRLLLLKLATALLALGLGAINQRLVTAKVMADPTAGRRWLGRTLAFETVLFFAAIAAIGAATTLTGPGQ